MVNDKKVQLFAGKYSNPVSMIALKLQYIRKIRKAKDREMCSLKGIASQYQMR